MDSGRVEPGRWTGLDSASGGAWPRDRPPMIPAGVKTPVARCGRRRGRMDDRLWPRACLDLGSDFSREILKAGENSHAIPGSARTQIACDRGGARSAGLGCECHPASACGGRLPLVSARRPANRAGLPDRRSDLRFCEPDRSLFDRHFAEIGSTFSTGNRSIQCLCASRAKSLDPQLDHSRGDDGGDPDFLVVPRSAEKTERRVRLALGAKSRRRRRPPVDAGGHSRPKPTVAGAGTRIGEV